jgi:tryptophan synthase alpha chain
MSRLETSLRAARDGRRKALVPFLTGSYPDGGTFVDLLLTAERAGADAVEVGIPFSDPSADGPVVQRSSTLALRGGATVGGILSAVTEARRSGLSIPLLFMTYYNPVLAFGGKEFAAAAGRAGADGVLVVDLPPEEAAEFAPCAREAGLATVFLVSPTTPVERIPRVLAEASGFVYCVSVTGVTGQKRPEPSLVSEVVGRVRACSDLPALVGFGVEDGRAARDVAALSDGVVIGSALLRAIGDLRGDGAVRAALGFLSEVRAALDAA